MRSDAYYIHTHTHARVYVYVEVETHSRSEQEKAQQVAGPHCSDDDVAANDPLVNNNHNIYMCVCLCVLYYIRSTVSVAHV